MSYIGSPAAPQIAQINTNSVETQDIQNGAVTTDKIANGAVTQAKLDSGVNLGVKVSAVDYPGDDLAADPAGGQTVTITGAGFASTPTVYIDTTIAPSVTFVSSTEITFTTPAKAAGTYNVYVVNPDGGVGIRVMGISYSGTPTWVTSAGSLGSVDGEAISVQLVATGDTPLVYSLTTGSTLPAGVTLSSSGLISGTLATEQTFSFSVDVTDPENQTTPRSFSVTVTLGEPDFKFVTLLLHGDGTSGAQNNTFLDSSTNNFTITRNGNTTQGTFSPFSKVDGRWGNYFDGDGDSLSVAYNSAFVFGTDDFTVEAWVYIAGNSAQSSGGTRTAQIASTITTGPTSGWEFKIRGNGSTTGTGIIFSNRVDSTTAYEVIGEVTVNQNQWNHVAAVRSGTTTTIYLNGTSINSGTLGNQTISSSNSLMVGRQDVSGYTHDLNGYISNFRIVKGTAVYTSNFTVPTSPLTAISGTSLLTCQSNRFKDNSSNNFAITANGDAKVTPFSPFPTLTAYDAATNGGSGYFDGTDDRLSIAETSATRPGSSNFCFECFFYPTALPTIGTTATDYATLFSQGTSGVYAPLNVYYAGDKKIMVNISSTGSSWDIANTVKSNGTCELNQWTHVAMTRNGNNFDLYLNGVFDSTIATSSATLMTPTEPTYIGLRTGTGTPYPFTGYISSWRWVVGSAVYTSAFTPPTAPVTAISNTSLLLNFTNAGIIDNSMSNNLETVGNAQISTSVKKYGTGSIYIPSPLGQKLKIPPTRDLVFGTSDFTMECWYYAISKPDVAPCLITNDETASFPTNYWAIHDRHNSAANKFSFWAGNANGSAAFLTGTTNVQNGTWYHVAVTRSGSTFRLFVDGVVEATGTSSASLDGDVAKAINIGRSGYADSYMNGYIDDLRITKGKARYTSNFTPPTSAFADKGQA